MIHRAYVIFIFSSPLLLIAMTAILVGQFGAFSIIVLSSIMIALLLATKNPPSALITPEAASKLITISILPMMCWSIFFWSITAGSSYLILTFKSLMMIAFPLAICTRWSIIHVIALCELIGMGSFGHRIPAGCEQIVLGGPIWVAESLEVFHALPKNYKQHHTNKIVNQVMQVFQLVILKVVDIANFVSTSKLFVVTNQGNAAFVEIPFRKNLQIIALLSIITLIVIVLAKV